LTTAQKNYYLCIQLFVGNYYPSSLELDLAATKNGGPNGQVCQPGNQALVVNIRVFNFEVFRNCLGRDGFETTEGIEGWLCCVKLSVVRRIESDGSESREKGTGCP
jgi:hypothetical protein